ncbi:hypothetical protein [Amorphus sp. 3PC139-8]|uniref:hypothetical protein n=1 Tax=Amorphus sp. 3PC139-8 TaxID=2735676 RepID=UPI00345C9F57
MPHERLSVLEDHYRSFAIAATIIDGIPVVLSPVGRYPQYLMPDGKPVGSSGPYVEAFIYDQVPEAAPEASLVVREPGRQVSVRLFEIPLSLKTDPDAIFDYIEARIDAVPLALEEYHRETERFLAVLEERKTWPVDMTRDDYERLTVEAGGEPQSDKQVSGWGIFGYPTHSVDYCRIKYIEQSYASALEKRRRSYAEQSKAAAQEQRQKRTDQLRKAPTSRTYNTIIPSSYSPEWLRGDALHVVVERKDCIISDDDPSVYGSHLLGHEGSAGWRVKVEVHTLERDLTQSADPKVVTSAPIEAPGEVDDSPADADPSSDHGPCP